MPRAFMWYSHVFMPNKWMAGNLPILSKVLIMEHWRRWIGSLRLSAVIPAMGAMEHAMSLQRTGFSCPTVLSSTTPSTGVRLKGSMQYSCMNTSTGQDTSHGLIVISVAGLDHKAMHLKSLLLNLGQRTCQSLREEGIRWLAKESRKKLPQNTLASGCVSVPMIKLGVNDRNGEGRI